MEPGVVEGARSDSMVRELREGEALLLDCWENLKLKPENPIVTLVWEGNRISATSLQSAFHPAQEVKCEIYQGGLFRRNTQSSISPTTNAAIMTEPASGGENIQSVLRRLNSGRG